MNGILKMNNACVLIFFVVLIASMLCAIAVIKNRTDAHLQYQEYMEESLPDIEKIWKERRESNGK